VRLARGANPTLVRAAVGQRRFAFFARDVDARHPILIPEYGVAVTAAADPRTYQAVEGDVRARGLPSAAAAIETAPEESYETACRATRRLLCPTWLGLGRDMRLFEVGHTPDVGYWGYVQPRYHSRLPEMAETAQKPYSLGFVIGPGASCRVDITRRLEDGCLPILHAVQREDDVEYRLTAFATLERGPIVPRRVRGSDGRACYANTGGNMLTAEERARLGPLLRREMYGREQETVCWVRVRAANTGRVPRYAWVKALRVMGPGGGGNPLVEPSVYESATGFARLASGRVYGIHRLDGWPLPDEEMAILLQPGETAVYDMLIPHQPLPPDRARALARQDHEAHRAACKAFWRGKLAAGAAVTVPEAAVDERIRAGLLHCDLVALGREPAGPVLATIGWYSPIGSESAPIIQFFDSMGWHALAERSLQFFLDRQRVDGFIQNFGGYQLETGPVLWSLGEHYRYTRDEAWVRRVRPNVLRACDYLLAWRDRNRRPELRGRGYGLLDGKVADPEDFFHSFMLNAVSHVGLRRAAEMLRRADPAQARRIGGEAEALRRDIRRAYYEALGRSPAVPLADGTWAPCPPPWTEYDGPVSLYAQGGNWFTHGAFGARDSLIGPLYLVLGEVLEPREIGAGFLLRTHQQLFTVRNAALSQPYYARHDLLHLLRGEVRAFLKTYYTQFASLQDRETYTFWEHYFHASQHKTHEEGWFLMQTRWMLWREDGPILRLLGAIPRRWLAEGQEIRLERVATYFGPLSLQIRSHVAAGMIEGTVRFHGRRRPRAGVLRLPHPDGRRATAAEGGRYDPAAESVTVAPVSSAFRVRLRF
jgi:hypothetical protein